MTLIELEKLGEATLNNAPKLEDICRTITDCPCSAMWCEHDMRNLGALKEAYASGAEAMRERCAKYLREKADHLKGDYNGRDLLDKSAFEIRALALTEAGK